MISHRVRSYCAAFARAALVAILGSAGTVSTAGAVDQLISGHRVDIAPLQDFRFQSGKGLSLATPSSGGADDPTVAGGTLRIFDTADPMGNGVVIPLPAGDWQDIGGDRFRCQGGPDCQDVKVTKNEIDVQCQGAALSLTAPFAGEVGVIVSVGTTPMRYCAVMGGLVIANDATAVSRINAAAPALCVLSGASRSGGFSARLAARTRISSWPTRRSLPMRSADYRPRR